MSLQTVLSNKPVAQLSLLCFVLLLTGMVLGDGILTPAQSVLGAIYGMQVRTDMGQGKRCPEVCTCKIFHFSRFSYVSYICCARLFVTVNADGVVGLTCAILICLFLAQNSGTGHLGKLFAPIILVYLTCNVITAATNIYCYDPSIFKV